MMQPSIKLSQPDLEKPFDRRVYRSDDGGGSSCSHRQQQHQHHLFHTL